MNSKICLAKSRFGVSQCFSFPLMTSEHESLIYAKVASVALKQKNLEGINIIYIVHFLYSFFNIVLEVFMKSKICLAKSRFGVSQCFAFVLSKENEPKVKDPFAEEFFAFGKNRSKTPRRYAPVFGAFHSNATCWPIR